MDKLLSRNSGSHEHKRTIDVPGHEQKNSTSPAVSGVRGKEAVSASGVCGGVRGSQLAPGVSAELPDLVLRERRGRRHHGARLRSKGGGGGGGRSFQVVLTSRPTPGAFGYFQKSTCGVCSLTCNLQRIPGMPKTTNDVYDLIGRGVCTMALRFCFGKRIIQFEVFDAVYCPNDWSGEIMCPSFFALHRSSQKKPFFLPHHF